MADNFTIENIIFSYGSIESGVVEQLNRRSSQQYRQENKSPWLSIVSGRRLKGGSYKRLKMSSTMKSFGTMYDQTNRPTPQLTGMNIKYLDEIGALKEIQVDLKIFNKEQLEDLLDYFFSPGVSLFVEWGIYNDSHMYEFQESEYGRLFERPDNFNSMTRERIKSSSYKYQNFLGTISNYNISVNEDLTYTCSINAISMGSIVYSFNLKNQFSYDVTKENTKENDPNKDKINFEFFVEKLLPELIDSITSNTFKTKNKYLKSKKFPLNSLSQEMAYKDNEGKWISFALIELIINFMSHVNSDIGESFSYKISSYLGDEYIDLFGDKQVVIKYNKQLKSTNIDKCFITKHNVINGKNLWGFESYESKDKFGEVTGYLRHIYISLEEFINTLSTSQTISDFFSGIYSIINSCFVNFWNFKLVYDDKLKRVFTVDLNLVKDVQSDTFPMFNVTGGNGFMRNISFSTELSDAQMLQTMYDSVGNDKSNESTIIWNLKKAEFEEDAFIKSEKAEKTQISDTGITGDAESNSEAERERTKALELKIKETEKFYKDKYSSDFVNKCQIKIDINNSDGVYTEDEYLIKKIYTETENRKWTPINAVKFECEIDGISNIFIGNAFRTDILPKLYSDAGVMQITNVEDKVDESGWITKLSAILRVIYNKEGSSMSAQSSETQSKIERTKENVSASAENVIRWIKKWFGPIIDKYVAQQAQRGFTVKPENVGALIYVETGGVIARHYDNGNKSPDQFAHLIKNKDAASFSYSFFQFYYPYWKDFIDSGKWKNVDLATEAAIQHLVDKRKALNRLEPDKSSNVIDEYTLMAYNAGESNARKKLKNDDINAAIMNNSGYVNKILTYSDTYLTV